MFPICFQNFEAMSVATETLNYSLYSLTLMGIKNWTQIDVVLHVLWYTKQCQITGVFCILQRGRGSTVDSLLQNITRQGATHIL